MKPLILVKGALARMRPVWRVLWRSQQLEHDMRDEIGTREIGIRLALGARPRGLLVSVFKRALRQIALGIGVGAVASGLLISAAGLSPRLATGLLVSVATIMLTVGAARRVRARAAESAYSRRRFCGQTHSTDLNDASCPDQRNSRSEGVTDQRMHQGPRFDSARRWASRCRRARAGTVDALRRGLKV
jgi:hypothetical protein